MRGLKVDWLISSITSGGIVRMFGILINEMCWIYFSLDCSSEPNINYKSIWKRVERGNDDDMQKLMYSILLFAEDLETEQFAREVINTIQNNN